MRAILLVVASAVCAAVWLAPLETVVAGPFSAHMLRHVAIVAVATPLLALGAPTLGRLAPPALGAVVFEFAVVWGWHLPALHDAAQASPFWFAAEQASFLAAGLAVWASALAPGRALAGAGGLLLTSMHMTLLGALVVLSGRSLYVCRGGTPTVLDDQQVGGIIMLGVSSPIYLVAGLALVARALYGKASLAADKEAA